MTRVDVEKLEARLQLSLTVQMVRDIVPGEIASDPQYLTNVGGTLFFVADDGEHGLELWKTDGTRAGTQLVKDIHPTGSSFASELININGTIYFRADDGVHGLELWKSDGTEGGTVLVKDLRSGELGSVPSHLTDVNGQLFMWAFDDAHGAELWASDGTEQNTRLIKDIHPGVASPLLSSLVAVGDVLFFAADDGTHSFELWKSDGTEAGTVLVKDINPGSGNAEVRAFANVNGELFFKAQDGVRGNELWKSDGTPQGTRIVANMAGDGNDWISREGTRFGEGINVDGTLFFSADNRSAGYQLWTSNGTTDGAQRVSLGPWLSHDPSHLTNVNGTVFYVGGLEGFGSSTLWKSDGTLEGTVVVKDNWPINFTYDEPQPTNLTNVDGVLFFSARGAMFGRELWTSDGSDEGTRPVADIQAGIFGSHPSELVSVGGALFFVADDGVHGRELWIAAANLPVEPVLQPIADQTLYLLGELEFDVPLDDVMPVGEWQYDLDAPMGAGIDPQTSTFRWRPEKWQVGVHSITVQLRDTGDDQFVETRQFNVTVLGAGGRDTVALFDPSSSFFFVRQDHVPGPADTAIGFGPPSSGWTPLTADWNGDGSTTVGFFTGSQILFRNSLSPGEADQVMHVAEADPNYVPLIGDFDGDGVDTLALYDPTKGFFHIWNSGVDGNPDRTVHYGPKGLGWVPLVGDWDGDGTDTIGLFDPNNSFFFLRNALTTGGANLLVGFGAPESGKIPIVGDWNGDGTTTIGLFDRDSSFFLLRNTNTHGIADEVFGFGPPGSNWIPLVGDWSGPIEATDLLVAEETVVVEEPVALASSDLTTIVDFALSLWIDAGLDGEHVAQLESLDLIVDRLPTLHLARQLPGTIVIDVDAAGHGWHLDSITEPPGDRVDLLTAVLHEMGAELGLATLDLSDPPSLMTGILAPGTRLLPTEDLVDELFGMVG